MDQMRDRLASLNHQPEARLQFEHESTSADKRTLMVNAQVVSTEGAKVYLLMIEDITQRRQAELLEAKQKHELESAVEMAARKLDRTEEELRSLTAHLFRVQEEERQKVARELHDDVAQRLSLISFLLSDVQKSPDKHAAAKIAEGLQHVQALNTDVRQISHQLHPAILEDLGLSVALKALVEEFGKREEMPATYVGRNLPKIAPQPATIAIYRITQEALRNVAKHAGKTHVKVILEARRNELHLEVRDFGAGFDQETEIDAQHRGLGLISMKERARLAHGNLSVTSKPGEGTTVIADVPFEAAE
jgi:signal transduction histidine kinase